MKLRTWWQIIRDANTKSIWIWKTNFINDENKNEENTLTELEQSYQSKKNKSYLNLAIKIPERKLSKKLIKSNINLKTFGFKVVLEKSKEALSNSIYKLSTFIDKRRERQWNK